MKYLSKLLTVLFALSPLLATQPASADVNDFSFESFDASYDISVNKEFANRPEMQVTETLVALFPETDQNRGIKRSIPSSSYGIYPGLIQVESVTDENGIAREYTEVQEDGFLSLYIKKVDESFVYGRQTYVIKYRQAWVIRNFKSSSGNDEFYWDVNGTGWLQNFGRVKATVRIDKELAQGLLPEAISCYQGPAGSSTACADTKISETGISFEAQNLGGNENLTIVVPFKSGTFNTSGPQVEGTLAWLWFRIALALIAVVLAWAIYFRLFRIKSRGNTSIIVPEYKPAASPSLLETSLIGRKTQHLIQALIVELAIKKQIEIEAVGDKGKSFILRRLSASDDEQGMFTALGLLKPGSQIEIGDSANQSENAKISKAIQVLIASTTKKLNNEGYFLKRALGVPTIGFLAGIIAYLVLLVSSLQLDEITDAGYSLIPILSFAFFASLYWLLVSKRAFTAKGSAVITHLKGLEMYIDLAEKDRLEFLQSPKGASLKASDVSGKQVLKLYEEVLPWAIVLGLQKQWSKVLTELYAEQGAPIWFVGTPFISQSFSSFDQALSSSLAVSSSGGSSGSGSSGSGGGGGGGSGI
jgi:uncharacterized membrane protein YgcG